MKSASINIENPYKVTVVITEMRYSLQKDMFEAEGQKVCEIQYEILAGKYVKSVPKLDEVGQVILKAGKPVMEDVLVDYSSPMLYHSSTKIIPFELYLLIEQYRATKNPELLASLNGGLEGFTFEGSLAGFVMQVTNVN